MKKQIEPIFSGEDAMKNAPKTEGIITIIIFSLIRGLGFVPFIVSLCSIFMIHSFHCFKSMLFLIYLLKVSIDSQ